LFLDEMAEFPRANLDTLRQPLEDGEVTVARRGVSATFPAVFQLVAATNPCPCGFLGDRRKPCECRPAAVARYRQRVSGPLLDRFDMVVKVDRLGASSGHRIPEESSESVASRVDAAVSRLEQAPPTLSTPASHMLDVTLANGLLTARGVDRVRSVATTIAALAAADTVSEDSVAEAMALRGEW
jgi:magnesium chelatase family protein